MSCSADFTREADGSSSRLIIQVQNKLLGSRDKEDFYHDSNSEIITYCSPDA